MAAYFASDMHLRLDRPDRARRLARWVDGLTPGDTLYLGGDVCDFWYAARQRSSDPPLCEGLRALAGFRAKGGDVFILPGNHDLWLGPYYERTLGARMIREPFEAKLFGLWVHLVHGHRVGGRQPWKSFMESRAFLRAFEHLPGSVATRLDHTLEGSNDKGRARDERRLLPFFRRYAEGLSPRVDLAVFGHVHAPFDDASGRPRLVVLGGWHRGSSFLKVDENGAEHVVDDGTDDPAARPLDPATRPTPRETP